MTRMKRALASAMLGLIALPAQLATAQDRAAPAAIAGDLRVTGAAEMAPLLAAWRASFEAKHPGARVVASLSGRASAIYGLEVRTADVALMDRALNPFERYGTYERSWTYPVEIEIGTGSAGDSAAAPAYAIFVHPGNPLRRLTLAQLDGVFGARRDGGWDRLAWNKAAARGTERDIRTWGQLGVRGPLRDKAIHAYGPPIEGQGAISGFQNLVLQGGAKWNEDYREYADPADMFAALAHDPAGIAFAALGSAPRGWVPLALATAAGQPFVLPAPATVADRSYPLARAVYLYFTIDTPAGDPAAVKPLIRAFARHVLSAEGQAELRRVSRYSPLPPALVAVQQSRVESDAWPQERPRP